MDQIKCSIGRTQRGVWVENKEVQRLCTPQWGHHPSFSVMILVILRAQFYSYEKGRKTSISEASKNNSTLHCLRTRHALCTALTCIPFFPAAFLLNRVWVFFSPFLISGSCGIFNRLQHFGVTFSWGGQLRCIITSCGKWWWCEGWEGGYWITKACFLFRKKWPCVRGPTSSCSVPRERAAPLHGVIGIRWTFACFHFYCFGDLLLLQSGSPVCCLFSVYMSEGSQRKHFNYILSRAKA